VATVASTRHSSSAGSAFQRTSSGAQREAEVGDIAADRVAERERRFAEGDRAQVDRQFGDRGRERDQHQAGGERAEAHAPGQSRRGLDQGIAAQGQQDDARDELDQCHGRVHLPVRETARLCRSGRSAQEQPST
jgi:hypothetical protein